MERDRGTGYPMSGKLRGSAKRNGEGEGWRADHLTYCEKLGGKNSRQNHALEKLGLRVLLKSGGKDCRPYSDSDYFPGGLGRR